MHAAESRCHHRDYHGTNALIQYCTFRTSSATTYDLTIFEHERLIWQVTTPTRHPTRPPESRAQEVLQLQWEDTQSYGYGT